mgnify:CR=1 FL=1
MEGQGQGQGQRGGQEGLKVFRNVVEEGAVGTTGLPRLQAPRWVGGATHTHYLRGG